MTTSIQNSMEMDFNTFITRTQTRTDTDLYAIIERMNPLIGYVTGIVCPLKHSEFLCHQRNYGPLRQKAELRMNTNTLDEALDLIRKNVIYPMSWFRIDLTWVN